MAEYRLSPSAELDLEEIWQHTAQAWSAEQADRYIDVLVDSFQKLAHCPKTAPACDHIRLGYRSFSVGRHMVYFRITPYGVAIVRVLHQRMDAPHHL